MFLILLAILIWNPLIYIFLFTSILIWFPHKNYIDYFFAIGLSTILLNFPVHYDTLNNFKKIIFLRENNTEVINFFYSTLKNNILESNYYIYINIIVLSSLLIWVVLYREYAYKNRYLTILFLLNIHIPYLLDQNRFYLATVIYIYSFRKNNIFVKILSCLIHDYFMVLFIFRIIFEKFFQKNSFKKIEKKKIISLILLSIFFTIILYKIALGINSNDFILHKIKAYTLNKKWGIFSFETMDLFLTTNRIIDSILVYTLSREIFDKKNQDLLEKNYIYLSSHIYFFIFLFPFNTFYQRTGIVLIWILLINFSILIKNKRVIRFKKILILGMFFIKSLILSYVSINLLREENSIFFNHTLKMEIFNKIKLNNIFDYYIPNLEYTDKVLKENT